MMRQDHEYDEVLRRALHSAADLVEPSADGLERIRARLTRPRPTLVAWVIVGYAEAVRPVLGFLQPVLVWLQATLASAVSAKTPVATTKTAVASVAMRGCGPPRRWPLPSSSWQRAFSR